MFPASFVAGAMGYESLDYFEINEEARNAPVVQFN
jgi:hypothetical protein